MVSGVCAAWKITDFGVGETGGLDETRGLEEARGLKVDLVVVRRDRFRDWVRDCVCAGGKLI